MLDKLLRAIHRIIPLMTALSDEERQKKLIELDQTIREMKSLGGAIRVTADKLHGVMGFMTDDVITNAERIGGSSPYLRDLPQWEPSQFDLAKLKSDHLRLRELIKKRNELERELLITIR